MSYYAAKYAFDLKLEISDYAYFIESFWIRVVDSKKSVSVGGILWKTTLDIDDLPLLKHEKG